MNTRLEFFHSFPKALTYLDVARIDPLRIRETASAYSEAPPSEKHLQAFWYDARYQPKTLIDHLGDRYHLTHPGQWNQEAGPDFIAAQLTRDSDQQILEGDAEIHLHPNGWKQHGHTNDPNYQEVKFHITWHPGLVEPTILPPDTLQFCLQDLGPFNFDKIDPSAYPWDIQSPLTTLQKTFEAWSPDEQEGFLEAAGQERLRRKTIIFADRIQKHESEQALYEGVLTALCYKQNKQAGFQLAQAIPHERLRSASAEQTEKAYALLMGIAGLLPHESPDHEASSFIRTTWDLWWKEKEPWSEQILSRSAWNFSSTRPANHPTRRFMAAASLFSQTQPLSQLVLKAPTEQAKDWRKKINELLQTETQSFWSDRLTLHKKNGQAIALVGKDRAAHIITNAIIPWLCAQNPDLPLFDFLDDMLPHEPMNHVIRSTAHALLGRDHSPKRYQHALQRQGLMQIYHDYGLNG